MITTSSIESYVDRQPLTVREAFSSLIANKSKYAQKYLRNAITEIIQGLLLTGGVHIDTASDWMSSIVASYSIEDLMIALEAASSREAQSFISRVTSIFRPITVRLMGFVLGLKIPNDRDRQLQIGDAMVLACLYLKLSEG